MKAAEDRRLKLYHALCLSLSDRLDQVAWDDFTPADWRLLAPMAKSEGVAPLLYWTLQHTDLPTVNVPPKILSYLTSEFYKTVAQNVLLYQALDRILEVLRIAQVPVIVLKGAALAATLYPDPALRPMTDLDLLVRQVDFDHAEACLRDLGYRQGYPEMSPGFNQRVGFHIYMESTPDQASAVELHWGLVAGQADIRTPDIDWFWGQVEEWKVESRELRLGGRQSSEEDKGSPVLALNPTAQLLYMAAHLMLQHGEAQARLLWYYDLHTLVSQCATKVDWDELVQAAVSFGWGEALHCTLVGAQARFHTPFPGQLLQRLAEMVPEAARQVAIGPISARTTADNAWDAILTARSWRSRLRLAWGLLMPSSTYMRWRYCSKSKYLWVLFYPYRWWVIFTDGISTYYRILIRTVYGNR
jgi:hypothetical protein